VIEITFNILSLDIKLAHGCFMVIDFIALNFKD